MSTTCGKCKRPLKDPKSIERGYGPLCWGKVNKARKTEYDRDQAMRSDFTYHTREVNGTSVLVIIDLDRGGMSVTNNVEAVGDIVEIEAREGIAKGIVTQVNVPEEEIAPFKDRAKSIIGKARVEEVAAQ